jgi:hypothetical protein
MTAASTVALRLACPLSVESSPVNSATTLIDYYKPINNLEMLLFLTL